MVKTSICSYKVNEFEAFVEKKNKKARKLDCPEIKITYGNKFIQNKMEYVEVFIDETWIKLNDWYIIGRIDENEGSTIVRGISDLSKYRNADVTICEHCHTNRPRKMGFIVENSITKETKQVGSSCLNDFLGHKSALQYAALISWIHNIDETVEDEEWSMGSAREHVYKTEYVLQQAAAQIRTHGYVSRAKAEEMGCSSTIDDIKAIIQLNNGVKIEACDVEKAKEAVEWFNNTKHEDSDYFYNLQTLIDSEYIKIKFAGILISLLPVYNRAQLRSIECKNESNYIGNVGDKKVVISGKCKKILSIESYYGFQNLYIIETPEGNQLKYFTQTNFANEGEDITFTATIKAHEEYKGSKQTIITRAKVIS